MDDVYGMTAVRILETCANNRYNMRELLKMLKQSHDRSYSAINELKNAGFIKFSDQRNRRGRPAKIMVPTPLGREFLCSYEKLQRKRLHLTDDNIRKAIRLANFTESLTEASINPYDRFVEMNQIALSIRGP